MDYCFLTASIMKMKLMVCNSLGLFSWTIATYCQLTKIITVRDFILHDPLHYQYQRTDAALLFIYNWG